MLHAHHCAPKERDLFDERALADAVQAVDDARLVREAAERRVRFASPGQITVRRQRLAEATMAVLAAEVRLNRLQRELGH